MASSALIPASRLFRFACPEDVTRMPERPAGHHCASCHKTVVDMSRLTPAEAIQVAQTAPPSTCVSYAFAEDGSLLFRSGRRVGGTVAIALSAFLAACNPAAQPSPAPAETELSPLEQVAEQPGPEQTAPTPTSAPEYHSNGSQPWPSATETTRSATPPARPVKKPLPPIRHTVGKPVQHMAGGIRPAHDPEL